MGFVYNLSIQLYGFLIRFIAVFKQPKAKLWLRGQQSGKKAKRTNFNKPNVAWFHCASLGEFEQGRPVIEAFGAKYPDYYILLTFFSPSGYEVRKHYTGADQILYLPLDTPSNVRRFLDTFQPNIVFFVKYEFWKNYLTELKNRKIPVILFSAIFRPNQIFFKWYGGFYRKILSCFQHLFVQNDTSKILLNNIGLNNITVNGDTRFDRVAQVLQQKRVIPLIEQFKAENKLIVVGSAWQADMELLIPFINQQTGFKFIIAPHEIKTSEIKAWQQAIQTPSICFSESHQQDLSQYQVIIIDSVGMLSTLYQYGDIAYIGGGLGKGLHNILEAATYGIAIMFGDKAYQKFQEANDLLNLSGAFAVGTTAEVLNVVENIDYEKAGKTCSDYVKSRVGATEKIIQYLDQHL